MSVVRTISTRLAVDGEDAYKKAIAACNSELSAMKSSLALVESQYKGNANSMEALTAKGAALSSLYDKQREKVDTLEKALANANTAQETYAKRVADAKEKISEHEKALKDLENTTGDTSGKQASLTAELDKWNKELEEAQVRQAAAERGVNTWKKQLNNANIELNNLNSEIDDNKKYLEEAKASTDGCASSIDQYGKKTKEAAGSVSDLGAALAAAGVAKLIKEIADAFIACAEASIEFESAITGVYKTVDGTAAELGAISDGIKEMALHIPATTTEIAAVAEAAGQLGIKTADVLSFTEVMVNLGVSTANLSAEQAASSLAKFANITKMSTGDYERLGSVIVDLGNNFATTESDIVSMATRLASAGAVIGLSESEIMAVATALSSVGIEAEAGGSAISKLLKTIEESVSMYGAANEVINKTGHSLRELELIASLDAKTFKALAAAQELTTTELKKLMGHARDMEGFASTAQMSSDQFIRAWGENAVGALDKFIVGLDNTSETGKTAIETLSDMGLTEVRLSNAILALSKSGGILTDTLNTANTAWEENAALAEEAGKRYATTESRLQMMENASNNLQIAIGDALSPALGALADAGTAAFQWAADFAEDHPEVVSAITGVVTALGILLGAVTALTVLEKIRPLIAAFNATLAANPAIAVAAAIAGLAVAIGTLIAKSNAATSATKEFTEKLRESKKEYEDSTAAIEKQSQSTANLAAALVNALGAEEKSAVQKRIILNLVDDLNEAVPDLGLAYDDVADSINMTTEALIGLARAEGLRKQNEEDFERLTTLTLEHEDAVNRLKSAEEELYLAEAAHAELKEGYIPGQNDELHLFAAAKKAVEAKRAEVEELTAAEKSLGEEMGVLTDRIGAYIDKQKAANEATTTAQALGEAHKARIASMEERITSITTEIGELQTAYDNAYASAYTSINQQLGLFNELDGTAKTSIDSLIKSLDSQINFMDTYAENIVKAMELGVDEGLVQKLSDGSEESAQILDAIVKGGGEGVAKLNENFAKVEEGKKTFSGLVAQMETDFKEKMGDLVDDLVKATAEMNVAKEAYRIGADNIQGLINGAASKKKDLVNTYTDLVRAAAAVWPKQMEHGSPSKKMFKMGVFDIQGLINGADSLKQAVGKKYAEIGETAYNAIDGTLQSGTFKSFDDEAKKSALNVAQTLKNQEIFLAEYNKNLKTAMEKGVSEGLLKTLMDGSEESAEILASLAKNTDKQIKEINQAFGRVEDGKKAFSDSIAQMQASSSQTLDEIIADHEAAVKAIKEAYEGIGEAAYNAIDSTIQPGKFKKLDGTAKDDPYDLITTLLDQEKFIAQYNRNLKDAMERGVDEGLLKTLMDGSEESAQILASIVSGTDGQIDMINQAFGRVEEGKKVFSNNVADMQLDFNKAMEEINKDLRSALEEFRATEKTYDAGADNIQGLIDGAKSKEAELTRTYTDMAKSAIAAFKNAIEDASLTGLARTALDDARRAMPSTTYEPSAAARQDRQTAEIISALSPGKETGGNTYINITSPEPMDERAAAREFKKAQRDLSLRFS